MFCPRCSAQNKQEQKFCRNCGLSLTSVRLALEGKMDEMAAELERSYNILGQAVGTLGIFIFAALINFFFFRWDWGMLINLVLGVLITIASTNQPASQVEPTSQAEFALPAVPDTDPILAPPVPGSIAEHTTFELKRKDSKP